MAAPNARTRRQRRNPGQLSEVLRATDLDQFTKSLLHANGTNGSTTITDAMGKVWTAGGTAALSTAQKKYGTASVLISNASSSAQNIKTPNHADWQLGTDDWTFEIFARFASIGVGDPVPIWDKRAPGSFSFLFQYIPSTPEFRFNWTENGINFVGPAIFPTVSVLEMDVWYHIALERDGVNLRCYLDGNQLGSTYNIGASSIFAGTSEIFVGTAYTGSYTYTVYFDELRFSRGVARWAGNFTPPQGEYY